MTTSNISEAAKAVIRRNTEEVQGGGNFEVFEELLITISTVNHRNDYRRRIVDCQDKENFTAKS